MPKSLLRIVAILLVPCLVLTSAQAGFVNRASYFEHNVPFNKQVRSFPETVYSSQALASAMASVRLKILPAQITLGALVLMAGLVAPYHLAAQSPTEPAAVVAVNPALHSALQTFWTDVMDDENLPRYDDDLEAPALQKYRARFLELTQTYGLASTVEAFLSFSDSLSFSADQFYENMLSALDAQAIPVLWTLESTEQNVFMQGTLLDAIADIAGKSNVAVQKAVASRLEAMINGPDDNNQAHRAIYDLASLGDTGYAILRTIIAQETQGENRFMVLYPARRALASMGAKGSPARVREIGELLEARLVNAADLDEWRIKLETLTVMKKNAYPYLLDAYQKFKNADPEKASSLLKSLSDSDPTQIDLPLGLLKPDQPIESRISALKALSDNLAALSENLKIKPDPKLVALREKIITDVDVALQGATEPEIAAAATSALLEAGDSPRLQNIFHRYMLAQMKEPDMQLSVLDAFQKSRGDGSSRQIELIRGMLDDFQDSFALQRALEFTKYGDWSPEDIDKANRLLDAAYFRENDEPILRGHLIGLIDLDGSKAVNSLLGFLGVETDANNLSLIFNQMMRSGDPGAESFVENYLKDASKPEDDRRMVMWEVASLWGHAYASDDDTTLADLALKITRTIFGTEGIAEPVLDAIVDNAYFSNKKEGIEILGQALLLDSDLAEDAFDHLREFTDESRLFLGLREAAIGELRKAVDQIAEPKLKKRIEDFLANLKPVETPQVAWRSPHRAFDEAAAFMPFPFSARGMSWLHLFDIAVFLQMAFRKPPRRDMDSGHYVSWLLVLDKASGHMKILRFIRADRLEGRAREEAVQSLERWHASQAWSRVQDLARALRHGMHETLAGEVKLSRFGLAISEENGEVEGYVEWSLNPRGLCKVHVRPENETGQKLEGVGPELFAVAFERVLTLSAGADEPIILFETLGSGQKVLRRHLPTLRWGEGLNSLLTQNEARAWIEAQRAQVNGLLHQHGMLAQPNAEKVWLDSVAGGFEQDLDDPDLAGDEDFSEELFAETPRTFKAELAAAVDAYRHFRRQKDVDRMAGRMSSEGYTILHAIPPARWRPPVLQAFVARELRDSDVLATGSLRHRHGFIGVQLADGEAGLHATKGFVLHEGTPQRLLARLLGFSRRLHGTDSKPFVWVVSTERRREGEVQQLLQQLRADPDGQSIHILIVRRGARSTLLATPQGLSMGIWEPGLHEHYFAMSWEKVWFLLEKDPWYVCDALQLLKDYPIDAQLQGSQPNHAAEKTADDRLRSTYAAGLDRTWQALFRYETLHDPNILPALLERCDQLIAQLKNASARVAADAEFKARFSPLEIINIRQLSADALDAAQLLRLRQIDDLLIGLMYPQTDLPNRMAPEILQAKLEGQFRPFALGPIFNYVRDEIEAVWSKVGRSIAGMEFRIQDTYSRVWLGNSLGGLASIPFLAIHGSQDERDAARIIFLTAADELQRFTRAGAHEKVHQLLGYLFAKTAEFRKFGSVGEADWFTNSLAFLVEARLYGAGGILDRVASFSEEACFQIGFEAATLKEHAERVDFIQNEITSRMRASHWQGRPALSYYFEGAALAGLAWGDARREAAVAGVVNDHDWIFLTAGEKIIRALKVPEPLTFARLVEIVRPQIEEIPPAGPGSDGKHLEVILPRMTMEHRPSESTIGNELLEMLKAMPDVFSQAFDYLKTARDAAQKLERYFEAWLHHAEDQLELHVGPLISRLVREQLRMTSILSLERKRQITADVMTWCAGQGLRASHQKVGNVYRTVFELSLEHGTDVTLEVEAVHHERSYEDQDHYVNAINMPVGLDENRGLRYAILLQDRACETLEGTFKTVGHEVWEVGLRALGYPPDEAHKLAIRYIDERQPIGFLLNHPRFAKPVLTSGPSASDSTIGPLSAGAPDRSVSDLWRPRWFKPSRITLKRALGIKERILKHYHNEEIPESKKLWGEEGLFGIDIEIPDLGNVSMDEILVQTEDSYAVHFHTQGGFGEGMLFLCDAEKLKWGVVEFIHVLAGQGDSVGLVPVENPEDLQWLLAQANAAAGEYVGDILASVRHAKANNGAQNVLVEQIDGEGNRLGIYFMNPISEIEPHWIPVHTPAGPVKSGDLALLTSELAGRLLPLMKRVVSGASSQKELEDLGFRVYRYSNSDTEKPEPLTDESIRRFAEILDIQPTSDNLEMVAALGRSRGELAKNIIDHGKDGIVLMGRAGNALCVFAYDNGDGIEDLDGVMAGTLKSKGGRFSVGNYALRGHRKGVLSMNGTFSIESHNHGLRYLSESTISYQSSLREGLLVSVAVPLVSPPAGAPTPAAKAKGFANFLRRTAQKSAGGALRDAVYFVLKKPNGWIFIPMDHDQLLTPITQPYFKFILKALHKIGILERIGQGSYVLSDWIALLKENREFIRDLFRIRFYSAPVRENDLGRKERRRVIGAVNQLRRRYSAIESAA